MGPGDDIEHCQDHSAEQQRLGPQNALNQGQAHEADVAVHHCEAQGIAGVGGYPGEQGLGQQDIQ